MQRLVSGKIADIAVAGIAMESMFVAIIPVRHNTIDAVAIFAIIGHVKRIDARSIWEPFTKPTSG